MLIRLLVFFSLQSIFQAFTGWILKFNMQYKFEFLHDAQANDIGGTEYLICNL